MGLRVDDHNEPLSTPKLSFSNLPCKPKQPIQMLTPPLHSSVSIPFQWEEAPGKPRLSAEEEAPPPSASKSRAARCLDLPPRLMMHEGEEEEVTIMPSPTMVLGGPYVGRSLSLACTLSFRKGPVSGREGGLRPAKKKAGCGSFGRSRRWRSWGGFKFGDEEKMSGGSGGGGSFDFSQSLGDIFKREKNAKITGIRRVRSFFDLSTINSNLLDIYARFKQAIPWRHRR